MPAMQTPPRRWTEEEFYRARDAAPGGERWELVDGDVLVTPSPDWSHQDLAGELYVRLRAYVKEQQIGKAFVAPLDVKFEPGLVMQPDILVVPRGLLEKRGDVVTRLLLAVECISPSSATFDRVVKRPRYQRNRVPEYWVLDADSRIVERWQPDDERPAVVSATLAWHPPGAAEPFVLDVAAFFREMQGSA